MIKLVYPFIFQTFSLTSEVFIYIHETLDQKIRLHSYSTLSKQPFATNFCTLMLSVAKIQIILKVYLLNFSVIFIHYSYLNINILESEKQMIYNLGNS